jgi:type VII secretion-associated serine protease mycosin
MLYPAILLVAMVCALLVVRPALAAPPLQESGTQTLLVHFDETATPEMRDMVIAEMGGELVTWMPQIHVAEVRLSAQMVLSAAALPSSAAGIVTFAENDLVVEAAALYNDPDLGDETMSYGLAQVSALDAWEFITGSQEIVIAVIDSGVKLDHPEFAGRLVGGYDFVNHDDQADDDMGHGTHVAGILAAALDNGQGVAGVCPNCRLMPIKVLNESNVGSWSQLAQGILFAVDNGAQILNLSLGASVPSVTLAEAIQYALDRDVIVVAAAGNYATDAPFYPAALDGVIAVGATNNLNERWARSNYGSYIDLVAPGALIYSTFNDFDNAYHGYTYMSGTSMAAPFVSGVAGLLLSANHDLTAQQVTDALVAGAEDLGAAGWDPDFGYGRVSALAALLLPTVGMPDLLEVGPAPSQGQMLYLPVLSNN